MCQQHFVLLIAVCKLQSNLHMLYYFTKHTVKEQSKPTSLHPTIKGQKGFIVLLNYQQPLLKTQYTIQSFRSLTLVRKEFHLICFEYHEDVADYSETIVPQVIQG